MAQVTLVNENTIKFEGEATIHTVESIVEALKALDLSALTDVSLDLAGLSGIDTAGVQVLLSVRASFEKCAVHSCPVEVRQRLEHVGFARLLT
jgi:anti-anti-sigma regulatory factor